MLRKVSLALQMRENKNFTHFNVRLPTFFLVACGYKVGLKINNYFNMFWMI